MSAKNKVVASRVRPMVAALHAYVPGEQPKVRGLIKLNTTENPYPPAPAVLKATRAAVDGRLRLYPNPTSSGLRAKLAAMHECGPENIFIGNGSDEVLAYLIRAFVEPVASVAEAGLTRGSTQRMPEGQVGYPLLRTQVVSNMESFSRVALD